MNVTELIAALSALPPEAEVIVGAVDYVEHCHQCVDMCNRNIVREAGTVDEVSVWTNHHTGKLQAEIGYYF